MFEKREGEQELGFDPAALAGDGHIVFIGRIGSPWTTRENCPKNMKGARESGPAGDGRDRRALPARPRTGWNGRAMSSS